MKCVSLLFYALSGVLSCSINMCFRCTVESNRLTFICKVDDLLWPVDIYDNHGNEIAHCALPNPASKCRHSNENANVKVNVEQFLHKNETVMVLTGTIDQRLNGNWSCHHGIKLYKANVVINILKATGSSIWIYIACGLIAICIVLIVILTYSCVKGFWTNKQGNSGGQSQPLMNISEGNSGGGQRQPFTTINEGNSGGQSQPLMNISEGNSGGGQRQPFTTINEGNSGGQSQPLMNISEGNSGGGQRQPFTTINEGNSGGQSQPLMNISEGNSGGGQRQPFTTINEDI